MLEEVREKYQLHDRYDLMLEFPVNIGQESAARSLCKNFSFTLKLPLKVDSTVSCSFSIVHNVWEIAVVKQ